MSRTGRHLEPRSTVRSRTTSSIHCTSTNVLIELCVCRSGGPQDALANDLGEHGDSMVKHVVLGSCDTPPRKRHTEHNEALFALGSTSVGTEYGRCCNADVSASAKGVRRFRHFQCLKLESTPLGGAYGVGTLI